MTSPATSPAQAAVAIPERLSAWPWALQRLFLLAFLAAIGGLIWLLYQRDRDEQQATLVSDVLWLEQNFHLQFERNAELLQRLGDDYAAGSLDGATLDARAAAVRRLTQGTTQIVLLEGDGKERGAWPPMAGELTVGEAQPEVPAPAVARLAAALGRPVYSNAYAVVGGDIQFEVHVPAYRNGRPAATVVGLYSLRKMLGEVVPWWFAEKYQLNVLDSGGNLLMSKTQVEARRDAGLHQVAFDPPGHGLALQVVAFHHETRVLPILLVVTIAGLASAMTWSLWVLRRHVLSRYAAEKALRDEYAFRKAMEDSLHTGLRARDLQGRVTYVNPAFCRMVGWPAEELVGRAPPMPYWPPEHMDFLIEANQRLLGAPAGTQGLELKFMRHNGERFDALIYEAPLIDAAGRHCGWMGSVVDITERRRAEEFARAQQERLQFTARLVTMGELASALAHELNQPLAAISSYSTGCMNRAEQGLLKPEELRDALSKLSAQARRAGQIIRRVHDFVRRSEPRREQQPVAALVEDAAGLLEADARRRGVALVLDMEPDLPQVNMDRVMIEQVLVNILRNAMDAMQDTAPPDRALHLGVRRSGSGVELSVADRGCGIAPEVANRLFDAFFTTKRDGMGMGLNICRSIMELHHGKLWFEARDGGGTVFHLYLPGAD
ncbi:MAG: PAS domain S-box protein [Rhodocyclaceae bacterium]|nr:PAS domain S-box protein [Rhodocyclaceae bacterium]